MEIRYENLERMEKIGEMPIREDEDMNYFHTK